MSELQIVVLITFGMGCYLLGLLSMLWATRHQDQKIIDEILEELKQEKLKEFIKDVEDERNE